MRVEEIDALLGGEAQRLADQYTSVPLDFMDGYGWAVTQICRLFHDAVPVRHAKWEDRTDNDDHYVYCSECGDEYIENDLRLDSWVKRYFKYCPNCGARMDEE